MVAKCLLARRYRRASNSLGQALRSWTIPRLRKRFGLGEPTMATRADANFEERHATIGSEHSVARANSVPLENPAGPYFRYRMTVLVGHLNLSQDRD